MEKHEIVPDVISTVPENVLTVKYDDEDLLVNLGNELTPTQVKNPPTVTWDADPDVYYTLCMTDPDAPSRNDPKLREIQHWLITNIPGNNISEGELLTAYIGAGPPEGSGLHRYVFLLYRQPDKLTFTEDILSSSSIAKRFNFSIQEFAKKYNLGHPLSGNFFQAQYDDYVPILRKQFEG